MVSIEAMVGLMTVVAIEATAGSTPGQDSAGKTRRARLGGQDSAGKTRWARLGRMRVGHARVGHTRVVYTSLVRERFVRTRLVQIRLVLRDSSGDTSPARLVRQDSAA